jgi:hypothetical protein
VKLAEDRIRGAEARAEAIRTRSYRQPGGQPAAPQAPGAAPGQQPAAPNMNDLLNRYAPR